MKNLETFINNNDMNNLDPLVKMAIIHHQFESIHPFFDGNGRTGRILNILYLIDQNLLDIPILYLSRYITQHKAQYYDLLQKTRSGESWEEWILFMVRAVEMTAKQTVGTIESIRQLMAEYKDTMRKQTKNYSHELINMLFAHPYTKIEYVSHALGVNRQTASRYLQELADIGLLQSEKQGRTIYYINTRLLDLFKSL
jgi:Fic family protein